MTDACERLFNEWLQSGDESVETFNDQFDWYLKEAFKEGFAAGAAAHEQAIMEALEGKR